MIRRCAQHQPHNASYGTAARQGERAFGYTTWGIGQFNSDMSRSMNTPDFIYPAIKLLSDEPSFIPGVTDVADPEPAYVPLQYLQQYAAPLWTPEQGEALRAAWERMSNEYLQRVTMPIRIEQPPTIYFVEE